MKQLKFIIIILIIFLILDKSHVFSQEIGWEQTNGPFGGTFISILVDPMNNIYATGNNGRTFQSTDDGENWKQSDFGPKGISINSIKSDSKGNIYLGTNDGLFRSNNDGKDWKRLISNFLSYDIFNVSINSKGLIFAATRYGTIFRSPDNGYSWTEIPDIIPWNKFFNGVVITSNDDIFLSSYCGIFRSTDNGDHWINTNAAIPIEPYSGNYYICDIASDSLGYLYAATERDGVYRSTDNGKTWIQSGFKDQNVNCISTSPDNRIFVSVFGWGITFSNDNGKTWQGQKLSNNYIRSIAFNSKGYIYAATVEEGLFRSKDGCINFDHINNGVINTNIYALTVNLNNQIIAGTGNGDIFLSSNNGDDWILTKKSTYIRPYTNTFMVNSKGYIFAGTDAMGAFQESSIYRSTDNGFTWQQKNSGIKQGCIQAFALDSSYRIFAGSIVDGMYRSTDDGETWVEINNGMKYHEVRCIGVSPTGFVFAGSGLCMYRSSNNGDSWQDISGIVYNKFINSVAFNRQKEVFITSTDGYLYHSSDNGNNWISINTGQLISRIYSMIIDNYDHIYISGDGGIIVSSDNGKTWTKMINGLTNTSITSFVIDRKGNLFAGTFGSGVFRSLKSTTSIEKTPIVIPANYSLEQNFPNPFNSSTTIRFKIPQIEFVSLIIYDILGKELAVLINEKKTPGIYNLIFNSGNLMSGIYFYRLSAGRYVEMKKLIILK